MELFDLGETIELLTASRERFGLVTKEVDAVTIVWNARPLLTDDLMLWHEAAGVWRRSAEPSTALGPTAAAAFHPYLSYRVEKCVWWKLREVESHPDHYNSASRS